MPQATTVRAALLEKLRVHPRVAQQGLGESLEARERLLSQLPRLVPFPGRQLRELLALLDWDHRLPSKRLVLRLHGFYEERALSRFEEELGARNREIEARNVFPEFDVADWDLLPGDESYEVELTPELSFEAMRLVSPWRRDVPWTLARSAVGAVRGSASFESVRRQTPQRASNLPDLECVGWMPPCESGHIGWAVEVWWLTEFDGQVGRGFGFLVDSDAPDDPVVMTRPFQVRLA